jgi:hypothetical protein
MDPPYAVLQFQALSSALDVSFWAELAKRKLEVSLSAQCILL